MLVAAGSYGETVTLSNGVSVYGGYSGAAFNSRVLGSSVVTATAGSFALVANGITTATTVWGVNFSTPDAVVAGGSSVAAYVHNAAMLTLEDVSIQAGHGADGAMGTVGTMGAAAGNGGAGAFTSLCRVARCAPGTDAAPAAGE